MTNTYSPSSIKTFINCPMQYRFKYIDGLHYNVADPKSYLGQVYHAFLVAYYTELAKGNTYRVFTNARINDLINSVSTDSVAGLSLQAIATLRRTAFERIIVTYLAKKPQVMPMLIDGVPAVEYEVHDIPFVHPVTGIPMPDTTIKCQFDLLTAQDAITEFKLRNHPFNGGRAHHENQMAVQVYCYQQLFGRLPVKVSVETMYCGDGTAVSLDTHDVIYTESMALRLWDLIGSINAINAAGLWYRNQSNRCHRCAYYEVCIGG